MYCFLFVLFYTLSRIILADTSVIEPSDFSVVENKGMKSIRQLLEPENKHKRLHYPYQINLADTHRRSFCSGTIVADTFAVTASSCFELKFEDTVCEVPENWIIIGVGHYFFNQLTKIPIDRVYKHPDFNATTKIADIAIIKIRGSFFKLGNLAPLTLIEGRLKSGVECYITGWGILQTDPLERELDPILNELRIEILTQKMCKVKSALIKWDNVLCAKLDLDVAKIYAGKFGETLYCNNFMAGLVSQVVSDNFLHRYAVFTDIYYYRSWILSILDGIEEVKVLPKNFHYSDSFRSRSNENKRNNFIMLYSFFILLA